MNGFARPFAEGIKLLYLPRCARPPTPLHVRVQVQCTPELKGRPIYQDCLFLIRTDSYVYLSAAVLFVRGLVFSHGITTISWGNDLYLLKGHQARNLMVDLSPWYLSTTERAMVHSKIQGYPGWVGDDFCAANLVLVKNQAPEM